MPTKVEWNDDQWRQFEALAQIQCTQEEIAAVMNCDAKTLRKLVREHYNVRSFPDALQRYRLQGKASIRRHQFRRARAGSDKMLIWLGIQELNQLAKTDITSGGERIQPPPITFKEVATRGSNGAPPVAHQP